MRLAKLTLITAVLLLWNMKTAAQFALKNMQGDPINIFSGNPSRYTVLVFMLPDCPACQSYVPILSRLNRKYGSRSIRFIGVFAGRFSKPSDMADFQSTYKPSFPLVVDSDHALIKKLGVTVAPEAVVIDVSFNKLYSGRIDDWMYSIGKKKTVIRKHDLAKALEELQHGSAISTKKTTPIGCIIE